MEPFKVPLLYLAIYLPETGHSVVCVRHLLLLSDMTGVAPLIQKLGKGQLKQCDLISLYLQK